MAGNNTVDREHDWVVLECRDPIFSDHSSETAAEIFISVADISSWNLPFILTHQIVKVKINRTRLIEHSSYFQSLLCGSFSESSMLCISIQWNRDTFLHILRFIHGCHTEVTISTFLPICHAALYFGLERLVSECRDWFSDILVMEGLSSQVKLDDLIHFWKFGLEHAIDWISGLCISFVARNFMWACSCDTFVDLPYGFLATCVKHPNLTVDSERHLCEALLAWLHANMEPHGQTSSADSAEDGGSDKAKQMIMITHDWTSILDEVHANLLPLWFLMGKSRSHYFSEIAKQGIAASMTLLNKLSEDLNLIVDASDWRCMKIRMTKYSKKLDLSGCSQITSSVLLLSILHQTTSVSPLLLESIGQKSMDLECPRWLLGLSTLSFEGMVEVDVSKCSRLHLGAAMECFRKSFPFLRTVRMAYFLDFETKKLCQLIENYSSVCEVDLTVDFSPLTFPNVSVLFSESVNRPALKRYFDMSPCSGRSPIVSNLTKLTLEGRSDFSDLVFNHIAEFCVSLSFLNIRGCVSVSDSGIANLILRCRNLHSIIATDTAFGRNSASALCSRDLDSGFSKLEMDNKHIKLPDLYLQVLHIGGCTGVSEASLCEILSRGRMLKSLCLRNTFLVDHALFRFPGSSLEILDVSNTMISRDALSHMLNKNPGLRCLEAKGCNNLCPNQMKEVESSLPFSPHGKLFRVLGQDCKLEELSVGWGFSFFSLNSTGSGLRFLKAVNLGLGGSLGPEGLTLLCALCPLLESVTILFQVISDTSIMNLLGTLRNLQALSICYCIGDVSPLCLNHSVPNLRKLNLERVTPWMTNDDLTLLVQNFANLVELSLVGCMHLGVDSQQIISSGWPGLVSLHLEDCGAVTAEGTSFLFGCKALEHLLLRHNGPGIKKSFILDAASRLPMLRSISLDWCDAGEGDFDLPHFADKYSLSNVKISRCKLRKCTLDFYHVGAQKRPVHKETLVLVWNSSSLQRTVVKERIA
ncbi:BTB/POZ domain-containing protein FBL11 isoform X2 [Chenopodium quinoa]|uniref:BTB/POZ domain-containing protein FBL11 isoform X2 n=1 Tax=Chenopodium quinoa TaxID=63459 RepID=UPI000B79428A|nr:BTB/POZ domain-containing protein FBL11 isoform X2 [Chenopodium quinoa]